MNNDDALAPIRVHKLISNLSLHKGLHKNTYKNQNRVLLQPHFEGSVRSPLTLPKMGLGSPPTLLKTQSEIAGVKTPCIDAFFIPLKRS